MKAIKKLNLAELKLTSFVTSDHTFLKETIKGGGVPNLSEGPPSETAHTASPNICNPSHNCGSNNCETDACGSNYCSETCYGTMDPNVVCK